MSWKKIPIYVRLTVLLTVFLLGSLALPCYGERLAVSTAEENGREASQAARPFGSFDLPFNRSVVSGSIAITGWALDDVGVREVQIYRDPVSGEGRKPIFVGFAIQVEGARPDIEEKYPGYPDSSRAGWGYMLLTNTLPNRGNGKFTFHAIVVDEEWHTTSLGSKRITCDNANAVKPFGSIDTPAQGGTISGKDYVNFGWALTPPPNIIPFSGLSIIVWVDGQPVGYPVYNIYRKDIANLFPEYNNSQGALGYFYLDTTQYENGVHTISWSVMDYAGNRDGIGSRYFTIQNPVESQEATEGNRQQATGISQIRNIPLDFGGPLEIEKGYKSHIEPEFKYPDENGITEIHIKSSDRVKLQLDRDSKLSGYSVLNGELRRLPVGSTLDMEQGVFYWQPGPAFRGTYDMVFISHSEYGNALKKVVKIIIE